jgi:hypothetical protein
MSRHRHRPSACLKGANFRHCGFDPLKINTQQLPKEKPPECGLSRNPFLGCVLLNKKAAFSGGLSRQYLAENQ